MSETGHTSTSERCPHTHTRSTTVFRDKANAARSVATLAMQRTIVSRRLTIALLASTALRGSDAASPATKAERQKQVESRFKEPWVDNLQALDEDLWWHYQEHGYLHLRGFFGGERFHMIEAARDHLDALWAGTADPETMRVVKMQATPKSGDYTSPKMWSLNDAHAKRARQHPYRLYNAQVGGAANPWHALISDYRLTGIISTLTSGNLFPQYGGPNFTQTGKMLLFERGTQQGMHLDTWYGLGARTHGRMAAAWVAIDNVTADNGPLIYVPGSHKILPRVRAARPGFDYSQSRSLAHLDGPEQHAQMRYIEDQMRRHSLAPVELRAEAGDVFIWHEMLYHGGAPIKDTAATRRSCVSHYNADSQNYQNQIYQAVLAPSEMPSTKARR